MRIRLTLAAVIAAATVLSAGCSSSGSSTSSAPGSGAVIPLLRVGVTNLGSSLDPTKDIGTSYIDDLALDTLMKYGPDQQPEPNLASSVTHPNPVTYVYHLRHGVKFWNGDPLTATDVAYTLNYVRAKNSQAAYVFPAVKSITATDPYTVTVTLPAPDASWVYTPAQNFTGIFEAKFARAHPGSFGKPGTLVMGSGPWQVDSFDPTTGAELSANPGWWGGKVPVQHVSIKEFASNTSMALAFRAGEIDLTDQFSNAKDFAAASGAKLITTPSCENGFVTLNTHIAPWNDVHVRRAVAYALNRSDIIAAAGGSATPIYTFIPPAALSTVASAAQVSQLLGSVNQYPYSVAKAKQEMAQSAYPHGVNTTITAWTLDNDVNIAQVISAELAKVGINARVKAVTLAAAEVTATGPAGARPSSFWGGGCITPDVSGYDFYLGSANLASGQWNEADWAPPAVDRWLAEGTTTDDRATRFAAFSGVVRQMSADVPYVPLYLQDVSVAISSKFTYANYSFWNYTANAYALGIRAAS